MKNTETYAARSKYTEAKAAKYQKRGKRRDAAEQQLVSVALSPLPRGKVLDAPCGGGRMSILLHQLGFQPTAADLAPAMVAIASDNLKQAGAGAAEAQDLERLGYADGAFDGALCFRLYHHLPTHEIRARIVSELCRVARSWVAVSYFHRLSFSSLKREWHRLRGKRLDRYHSTPRELAALFEQHGFKLHRDYAQGHVRHALHLALFKRSAPFQSSPSTNEIAGSRSASRPAAP